MINVKSDFLNRWHFERSFVLHYLLVSLPLTELFSMFFLVADIYPGTDDDQ